MMVRRLNSAKLSDILAAEFPHDQDLTPEAQVCPALIKCPSRDILHDDMTFI